MCWPVFTHRSWARQANRVLLWETEPSCRSAGLVDMARNTFGNRKWLNPLAAGLLFILALFAWKYYPASGSSLTGAPKAAPNNVYFGTLKSIAVLPPDIDGLPAGQEFRAAGFANEITRLLTLAPGLQVTSRNSALFFKEQSVPLRIIAERLQVTWLLSTAWESAGDGFRLTGRLYNARRDKEAWSGHYELDSGQIFGVQDEFLKEVAKAIRLSATKVPPPAEPVGERAWSAYLKGLYRQDERTLEGYRAAADHFQAALEIEPGYELARLSLTSSWLALTDVGDPNPEWLEKARAELEFLLQANPRSAGALGLSSYISRNHDWDWVAALEAANSAISVNPGDPGLKTQAGLSMFTLGQFSRATRLMETAVAQDPLNLSGWLRLGLLQEFSTDYDGALASYRKILSLNSDFPGARALRTRVKIIQDKPDSAMKESEQEADPFWKRYSQILVLTAQEEHEEAAALLDRMKAEDGFHAAYQVAEILAFRGDLDDSFIWLERALRQRDGGMKELIGNYFLESLHQDPRWRDLLARMGLPLDLES